MEYWKLALIIALIAFFASRDLTVAVIVGLGSLAVLYFLK